MSRPTINVDDCTFNYYKYYFNSVSTGKKSSNYLPIVVIDFPYSDAQMDVAPGISIAIPEMDTIGTLIAPFLNDHLPCAISISRSSSGVVSPSFPWTSYKDKFFTGSVSISDGEAPPSKPTKIINMSLSFDPSSWKANIGDSLIMIVGEKKSTVLGLGLLLCLLRSTDGTLYYNTQQNSRYASVGDDSVRHDAIISPTPDSFGGITYNPPFTINSFNFWTIDFSDKLKQIIGDSKKIDTKDPDPNIDDSGGDEGRTPTDDIGGDVIGDDDLPTLSVMDTGLVTLYNPTVKELNDLGRFLWSDAFSLDTFKKLFSDPFDTLLGLSILPVTPTVSGRHNIYFGNIDSGVPCNVVSNQFLKVDMGSLTLSETYASAFDYAPSTQVDIYLPFIGSHALNTNDVMGSNIHLIYKFDLLSGGCIAELFINHTSQGNKSKGMSYNPNMGLAYTFTGQCSCSIPLTSNNYNGMIQGIIQSIGTVGAIGASVATGNPALGIASVATSATTIGLQANTPTVQRSGSIGSSNALLSCLTPYLSVQRAHVCKPGHFYSKRGIPSQVYVDNISDVGSGNYFQIADCVDLHANGASDTELAEIKSILTSGAVW